MAGLVNWFDPNSVKENNVTSCKCSYEWEWDGITQVAGSNNTFDPEAYFVCYDEAPATVFEMRISQFGGPTNLTLEISHSYKDTE